MPIKLVDQFKSHPQFLVFESPDDHEDFVTVQLSVRLTDEESEDLSRRIEAIVEEASKDDEVDSFAAAVASGDPLDKLGEMVGLIRGFGESDAALRDRIERAKL